MKITNRKKLLLGLAATTLFGLGGCGDNEVVTVYGPPEAFEFEEEPTEAPEGAIMITPMDVNDNMLPDVYGPPPMEDSDVIEVDPANGTDPDKTGPGNTDPDNANPDDMISPDFDDNFAPAVYGPPEDFD